MFLLTSDTFTTYWLSLKACHITFRLHVYDMTFIVRGKGGGGGVTGEKVSEHFETEFKNG